MIFVSTVYIDLYARKFRTFTLETVSFDGPDGLLFVSILFLNSEF